MFKDSAASKVVFAFSKPKGQNDLVLNPEAKIPFGLDLNQHIQAINDAAQ